MQKKYFTAHQVLQRYDISNMTLWRWLRDEGLKFPRPIVIRRRRMFDEEELNAFDKRQRCEVA